MIPIKNNSLARSYEDSKPLQQSLQSNHFHQQENNLTAIPQALQAIGQGAQNAVSSEKNFHDKLREIVFSPKQINSPVVLFPSPSIDLMNTSEFERSFHSAATVLVQTLVTISFKSNYRSAYQELYLDFFRNNVIPRKIPLLSQNDRHISIDAERISKFQMELLSGLFNDLDYLPNTPVGAGNRYALYIILKKVLAFSNISEKGVSSFRFLVQDLFRNEAQIEDFEISEPNLHERQRIFEAILNLCISETGCLTISPNDLLQTQISNEFESLSKLKSFCFQQSVNHLDYLITDLNLFSSSASEFIELQAYRNTLIQKVKDILPRSPNGMQIFSCQTMAYINGEYKCVLFFNEPNSRGMSLGHIFQRALFQEFLKQYQELSQIQDPKIAAPRYRILGSIFESCNFVINSSSELNKEENLENSLNELDLLNLKKDYFEKHLPTQSKSIDEKSREISFFSSHVHLVNVQKSQAHSRNFKVDLSDLLMPVAAQKKAQQRNIVFSLDNSIQFNPNRTPPPAQGANKEKPSWHKDLKPNPSFFRIKPPQSKQNASVDIPSKPNQVFIQVQQAIENCGPKQVNLSPEPIDLLENDVPTQLNVSDLEEKSRYFSREDIEFAKSFNKKLFNGIDTLFEEEKRSYKAIKEFIFTKGQGYWFIPLLLPSNDETYESRSIHQIQKKLIEAIFRAYTSVSETDVTKYVLYTFCKSLNFTITEEAQRSVSSYSKKEYIRNFLPQKAAAKNIKPFMAILELAINEKYEQNKIDKSILVPLDRLELKQRAQAALFYLKFNQMKRWNQEPLKEKPNLEKTLHGLILIDSNEKAISGHDMQLKLQPNGNIESLLMGINPPITLTMPEIESLKDSVQKHNLTKSIDGGSEIKENRTPDFIFDPAMMQLSYDQVQGNHPEKSFSQKSLLDQAMGSSSKGQAPSLPSGQSSQRIIPLESKESSPKQKNQIISSSSSDKEPNKRFVNITFDEILQKTSLLRKQNNKQNETPKSLFIGSLEQQSLDDTFESFIANISNRCLKSCSGRLQKRHGIKGQTQPLSYGIIDKLTSIDLNLVESVERECTFPYQIAKEYQLTALKALKVFQASKVNTVIGWDVGTGKTHLIIGEILQKISTSQNGSFLICAPFSLINQTKESVVTHFTQNRLLLLKNKFTKRTSRLEILALLEIFVTACNKEKLIEENPKIFNDLCQTIHNKIVQNRSAQNPPQNINFKTVETEFNKLPPRNKFLFQDTFSSLENLIADLDQASPETIDSLFNALSLVDLSGTINKNFVKTILSVLGELIEAQDLAGNQETPSYDYEVKTIQHLFSIDTKTLVTASNSVAVIKNAIENFSSPYNILIATPDALCKLKNEVESIHWSQLFFDEAHLIARNSSSKKWQKLRPIVQTLLNHPQEPSIRLLTATPFQGQISDLFNLMSFAHKDEDFNKETYKKLIKQLGSCQRSLTALCIDNSNQRNSKQNLEPKAINTIIEAFAHFQVFKKIANSCIYQLKKDDPRVVKAWGGNILTKKFQDNNYPLTPQQEKRITPFLESESLKLSFESSSFFSIDYALDALLLHPQIPIKKNVDGSKNTEVKAQQEALLMRISNSQASGGMNDKEFNEFINESGFLKAFFESTKDYVHQKKRWITFVDQIFHGKFLAAVIKRKFGDRLNTSFFSGEAHAEQRTRVISEFKSESNKAKCMLMTIQAGGVGLNIPGVDVHLLAKPWDPSCEEQAIGRSDRVGNSGEISVHRYKNPGLDKRYTEIVGSKKAWQNYLTNTSENLIDQFDRFFDLISIYLVNDSDKEEKKIDKDMIRTIHTKIHDFIESTSPNSSVQLLQNYIDNVSPPGLPNFLKIQEIALRAIKDSSIIANRSEQKDEKQSSAEPVPERISAHLPAREKIPAAKVDGRLTITVPRKSPEDQLIAPKEAQSLIHDMAHSMNHGVVPGVVPDVVPDVVPGIAPSAAVPQTIKPIHLEPPLSVPAQIQEQKKASVHLQQQPSASSSKTPYYSPSAQKQNSPSSLPSKISFRDASSNTVSNFDVISLHQVGRNLENALQLAVSDLQVRLTPKLKVLNNLIQNFRKEHPNPKTSDVRSILEESTKAGIVYSSVEECQKVGFQVEIYEIDKINPTPTLKKPLTYPTKNPKGTTGTVRLLVTKENNQTIYSVLLRSR